MEKEDQFWAWLQDNELPPEERVLFPRGMDLRVLRPNPLTKRWTLYNQNKSGGALKPSQYKRGPRASLRALEQPECGKSEGCPFCPGTEQKFTPAELCRICTSGELEEREGLPADENLVGNWLARAVRNKFPYLATPPDLYGAGAGFPSGGPAALSGELDNDWTNPDPDNPLYPQMSGFGASEVIIESPQHNAQLAITTGQQIAHALRLIVARGKALRQHPTVKQLAYFKQYGITGGGSLVHPHMQIHTMPMISGYMQSTLRQHRNFFSEHGICAVERLYVQDVTTAGVAGYSRLVRETPHFVASVPYAAYHKGRLVIAPKRHTQRFEECSDEELLDLGCLIQLVMSAIYRISDDPDYNLWWETLPTEHAFSEGAEKETLNVIFRWSLHVRASRNRMGITSATGVTYASDLPEQVARGYRDAIDEELRSPLRNEPRASAAELLKEKLLAAEKEVEALKRELSAMEAS